MKPKNLYDGVGEDEVFKSVILAARLLIESEPALQFSNGQIIDANTIL